MARGAQNEIANTLPTFKGDIGVFESTLQSLKKNYESFATGLSELNAMWEGPAHEQLMMELRKDCAEMDNCIKFLDTYLSDLNFAHEEYSRCENTVSGLVDAIRV